jgi:recombination protein RecT
METQLVPQEKPKQLSPVEECRRGILNMQGEFEKALPPQISVDKFIRVVMTAIQGNADLLNSDRKSLFSACVRAAQDGLLPDGREAALVMFKGCAAYMPMVSGILKKVRNSGELASITSQVVHKADKFRYWVDIEGEHIEHEPVLFGESGELIGVYALAKTKDGAVYIEVMSKQQIEQVRNVSRAKDGGPWKTWYNEMARKTAIRRLSKRLPMSTDLESVIRADDEMYDLKGEQTAEARKSSIGQLFDDSPGPSELEMVTEGFQTQMTPIN